MQMTGLVRAMLACTVLAAGRPARAQSVAARGPAVTASDIRFMQEMLGHHRQAILMTAMVKARARRPDLRLLAERITVSQVDEIAQMRRWLNAQGVGEDSSMSHDMSAHAGRTMPADAMPMMPGMLTVAQMDALRRASSARFDRLFLNGMIQHHEGALTMVRALLQVPGAAQESSINHFVIEVDADQRAEIARMRRMLSRR